MSVPAHVAADTGLDVLTHATEAYVSVLANDFTDGLALQAIKLVFEHLERSVKDKDPEAREKCTMRPPWQGWHLLTPS